ncbi:MAG: hypothetical protein WAT39_13265 [Planctomycetota bacterium]
MKRPGPDHAAVSRLAARVLQAADLQALGEIYFHEGGERELRQRSKAIVELGERLARALLANVPRRGASLWVGAGIAELPVLLAETMLAERTVVATNLRANECELLNAALAAAAPDVTLRYVAGDARQAEPGRTFDHLGCISLFTDPETWPVLAGVTYGRLAPVQVDVERFVAERDQARSLARDLFARLQRPGIVTTSAEEVAWFLEQGEAAGTAIEAGDELIDTAVVGDPVGFLTVR